MIAMFPSVTRMLLAVETLAEAFLGALAPAAKVPVPRRRWDVPMSKTDAEEALDYLAASGLGPFQVSSRDGLFVIRPQETLPAGK